MGEAAALVVDPLWRRGSHRSWIPAAAQPCDRRRHGFWQLRRMRGQGQQSSVVEPSPSQHGDAAVARVRADVVREDGKGGDRRRGAFQVCLPQMASMGKDWRLLPLYVIGLEEATPGITCVICSV
jgi:hypothetical protein